MELDNIEQEVIDMHPSSKEEHYEDPDCHNVENYIPKSSENPSTFIHDFDYYFNPNQEAFLNNLNLESDVQSESQKLFQSQKLSDKEQNLFAQLAEENQEKVQTVKKKKERKEKIEKKYTKTECKNFLPFMKKLIWKCYQKYVGKPDDQVFKQISGDNANRRDFQMMFKRSDLRQFLGGLFKEKRLHRELQYSRIDSENRILFIRKINLMAKGFTMEKLPNL